MTTGTPRSGSTPLTLPRVIERKVLDGDHERDVRELGAGAGFEDFDGAVDDGEATDLLRERSRESAGAVRMRHCRWAKPTQRT
jgi:hypothetical protein